MICAFCDNKSPKTRTRTRVCPPKKNNRVYRIHRLSFHIVKYSVKAYSYFCLFFVVLFLEYLCTVIHRNVLRTHFYVKFQSFALTKFKLFDITNFIFFSHKTCTVRSTNKQKKKIKKIYLHMLLLFLRLHVGNFEVTKVFCLCRSPL